MSEPRRNRDRRSDSLDSTIEKLTAMRERSDDVERQMDERAAAGFAYVYGDRARRRRLIEQIAFLANQLDRAVAQEEKPVYTCEVCGRQGSARVVDITEPVFKCRTCVLKLHGANGTKAPPSPVPPDVQRLRAMGLDDATHADIFDAQDRRCAICHRVPGDRFDLHIDHDHKTGQVRGLLCASCNHGIGLFKDNPEHLGRAKSYVEADHSGMPLVRRPGAPRRRAS